jgi:hypothetical protein
VIGAPPVFLLVRLGVTGHDHDLVVAWRPHAQLFGRDAIDTRWIFERCQLGPKLIMRLQQVTQMLFGSLQTIGKSNHLNPWPDIHRNSSQTQA